MVNSRSIRQFTSLVAAVAVVGAIGVLPAAAAVGGPVDTTTTIWLDNPESEYGDAVTGGVSVDAIVEGETVFTGRVTLFVDDVEVQTSAIDDQPLVFELDARSLPGAHTITAKFASDGDFAISEGETGFTVALVASNIVVGETSDLVFGQPGTVGFVIEAGLAPTGEVTLTDGGVAIATGTVEIEPDTTGYGIVLLELPDTLEPGVHTAMLAYAGNDFVGASESELFEFSVAPALTRITVTSLPDPLVVGQNQTLVVEATPLAGQVAGGSVEIEWDGELLGTVDLVDGRGELALASPLPVGTRTLFLYYSGDGVFYEATVDEGSVEVIKAQPVVAVTVPASVAYGAGASGSVTVRLPDGNGGDAPVGETTVQLTATRGDEVVDLGSAATDADGALTFELPADLAVGDWTISASIDETDETFGASDDTAALAVTQLSSITTGVLADGGVTRGVATTIEAGVTVPDSGVAPTGEVVLRLGDAEVDRQMLVDGAATLTVPAMTAVGWHAWSVQYVGSDEVAGSDDNGELEVGAASAAVGVELGSVGGTYGSSTAVTARVNENTAGGAAASGMVQIVVDDEVVATQPLVGGTVIVDLPGDLAMGAHRVVVRFVGTTDVAAGESRSAGYTVGKAASATAVALSVVSANHGAGGAVATIRVTVPAARSVRSEGTVVLLNGTDTVGSYPLVDGSVAVPLPSSLAVGAHSLTARFEGSPQVEASTSEAATLTIVAGTPVTGTPVTGTPVTGTPAAGTPVTGTPVVAAPTTGFTPAAAPSASAASRALAATGANVQDLVAGALALLALGTVTTALAARRRSARTAAHRAA